MKRIIINKVSKKFEIGFKKDQNALMKFISFFSGRESKREFFVLKDVSFDADAGENVGLIGKNGSGKSTLLRIIAGIYELGKGNITSDGKLVYLSGFGTGLKKRLTMKENIYLIGSILGLNNKEIKSKFSEIVKFSGLKDFVDTKVYQFSDGMLLRLIFSITTHYVAHEKPEVLLLDEIFAGGDEEFRKKAVEKMEDLIKGGATVILVSHDLDLIKKYCDKVIWLEKGRIRKQGKPDQVTKAYLASGDSKI